MAYLNHDCIRAASAEAFQNARPYPWVNLQATLTPEGFEQLRTTLPDVTAFERHVGRKRAFGQGYQDRYLLHYRPGVVVSGPWREFLAELHRPPYQAFLRRLLGVRQSKRLILTKEWYYAWEGCPVPPHCDARRKLATHLFYFNTDEDWHDDWGGHILLLDDGGRLHPHTGPSFDDLAVGASIDPRGNGSLLFRRTEHSWHGVRPLECPPGQLRKLFIITINALTWQVLWRRLRGKDPDGYPIRVRDAA
jgi:hypothetical protein